MVNTVPVIPGSEISLEKALKETKTEIFQVTLTKPPPRLDLEQKEFVMRDTTKYTKTQ